MDVLHLLLVQLLVEVLQLPVEVLLQHFLNNQGGV